MALSPADLDRVRDEVGSKPDDATLNGYADELTGTGTPTAALTAAVALRVLKRRRADLVAGPSTVAISGAVTVGLRPSKDLDAQIARLEAEVTANGGTAPGGVSIGQMFRTDALR